MPLKIFVKSLKKIIQTLKSMLKKIELENHKEIYSTHTNTKKRIKQKYTHTHTHMYTGKLKENYSVNSNV